MIRLVHSKDLLLPVILLVSCGAPSIQPAPTAAQTPAPVQTSIPTDTAVTTPTAILGFEDWSVVNPQAVDIQMDNGSFWR